jgi:hypothetical protein
MTAQLHGKFHGGSAPENSLRFFVPSIGGPMAEDLIGIADL